MLLGIIPALLTCNLLLTPTHGKWVEGHIDTKQNWAFVARFCFLSLEGQFEYLIEYDRDMGTPNLLLYYDDQSQWPAVYHTKKTCREKESVLNKAGQNQIIQLSHWYPETELSGCVVKRENKEMPASKSMTTTTPATDINHTRYNKSTLSPPEPSYYDQFLKTTSSPKESGSGGADGTTWYEPSTESSDEATTQFTDDGLWESVNTEINTTDAFEKLKDVEILFGEIEKTSTRGKKTKRSSYTLYELYKQRRLNAEANGHSGGAYLQSKAMERLVVSCHNSRRFRSARERWWFIAISNCDSNKGLDVRYKFMMTNGAEGDFWHLHFSADEFYVLPILITYTFAYVIVMIAVVMCSVELKSRHLLHSTYKLFLISIVVQHCGIVLQTLAYLKYGSSGTEYHAGKVFGQFACGMSEMTYILLLVLMAKGYTITRGRLKVSFTVKLTIFMCCYCLAYIILFIYQDKAFDPGEVLYLYESPPGYGLITLRILAWCMFSYATFFTVKKFPEKNMFYCPFFVCGTLWFFAGPLFILTANSYIDKWVRESVVIAVSLFITFSGHIMFLLLTLPVFANKNFPYHVRTTQIGVMQTRMNDDSFGPTAYHPHNETAHTVIIPLTRRTEELIGNMYNEYMATAPPLSLEDERQKQNDRPMCLTSFSAQNNLIQQDSTDTNTSGDIKPNVSKVEDKIFTVDDEINKLHTQNGNIDYYLDEKDLPTVLRPKRNILEPINKDAVAPPSWSLAKNQPAITPTKLGAISNNGEQEEAGRMILNASSVQHKRAPPVRNGLQQNAGEISTILEGHVHNFQNPPSKATMDLFNAKRTPF